MRIKTLITATLILATTQACSVPLREFRHAGGYPGYQMDRHLFVASRAKKLQLLRLTMILALASRVGAATVRDGQESEAFIRYMRNATNEVNYLAAHLYGQAAIPAHPGPPAIDATPDYYACNELNTRIAPIGQTAAPDPVGAEVRCHTYSELFESDLPQLEYKVMRLVIAALPREHASRFAGAVRTGNVASAAWRFLRLAAASIDALHRGAAVQRSTQEILAVMVRNNNENGCAVDGDRARHSDVERSVLCLGRSLGDLFDTTEAARETVTFPTDEQIGREPFDALYAIIQTSCTLLPIDASTAPDTGTGAGEANPVLQRQRDCRSFQFRPTLRLQPTAARSAS